MVSLVWSHHRQVSVKINSSSNRQPSQVLGTIHSLGPLASRRSRSAPTRTLLSFRKILTASQKTLETTRDWEYWTVRTRVRPRGTLICSNCHLRSPTSSCIWGRKVLCRWQLSLRTWIRTQEGSLCRHTMSYIASRLITYSWMTTIRYSLICRRNSLSLWWAQPAEVMPLIFSSNSRFQAGNRIRRNRVNHRIGLLGALKITPRWYLNSIAI